MSTDTSSTSAGEPVPRDPSAYRPTNHFRDRFRDATDDPPRHLDGEIVRTCITEGRIDRRDSDAVRFKAAFDGVTYVIVADPEHGTVLTGFPTALDWQTAIKSNRWTRSQLEDIDAHLKAKSRDQSR